MWVGLSQMKEQIKSKAFFLYPNSKDTEHIVKEFEKVARECETEVPDFLKHLKATLEDAIGYRICETSLTSVTFSRSDSIRLRVSIRAR